MLCIDRKLGFPCSLNSYVYIGKTRNLMMPVAYCSADVNKITYGTVLHVSMGFIEI